MSIYVKNGALHVTGSQDKLRAKGEEKPGFISDYTMLDIETTGLNPYRDHVTELGAVKVRNNEIVAEFSKLVVYPRSNKVPAFITKLNGITTELLLSEGVPVKEAMTEFRGFIGDDIIIGYNVNFDLNFLYDLTEKFHLPALNNDYVDVLRLARAYYPFQHNRLLDCNNMGGQAQTIVTPETNYLIIDDDHFFSNNNEAWQKAQEYNKNGSKIKRLSESYFLNMLDEWARS